MIFQICMRLQQYAICLSSKIYLLDLNPYFALKERSNEWFCESTSIAWVVRMESLVSILDVESCNLQDVQADGVVCVNSIMMQ